METLRAEKIERDVSVKWTRSGVKKEDMVSMTPEEDFSPSEFRLSLLSFVLGDDSSSHHRMERPYMNG